MPFVDYELDPVFVRVYMNVISYQALIAYHETLPGTRPITLLRLDSIRPLSRFVVGKDCYSLKQQPFKTTLVGKWKAGTPAFFHHSFDDDVNDGWLKPIIDTINEERMGLWTMHYKLENQQHQVYFSFRQGAGSTKQFAKIFKLMSLYDLVVYK